jgi:hypothetical protein
MTELWKKGVKFVWDEDCEKAFHTLRAHLTIAPINLTIPTHLMFTITLQVLVWAVFLCKTIGLLPMLHEHFGPTKRITQPMILS